MFFIQLLVLIGVGFPLLLLGWVIPLKHKRPVVIGPLMGAAHLLLVTTLLPFGLWPWSLILLLTIVAFVLRFRLFIGVSIAQLFAALDRATAMVRATSVVDGNARTIDAAWHVRCYTLKGNISCYLSSGRQTKKTKLIHGTFLKLINNYQF